MVRSDERLRPAPSSTRSGALRGATLAALLGILAPAAAQAQPAAEPEPPETEERPAPSEPSGFQGIEVLVIKGKQHEDLLADTAVSGMTFDASELSNLRIQDISDLAEFSPNVDIKTRSAASNPTLFIRGICLKDYNANSAGAVAIFQDGVNINSPAIQLFQLFDVDTVEVLRGPQGGAINARNATAGAIRVTSVLPSGEFGGTGSFTYGNYNTLEADGALSLPLIDELLSARFAFTASFADGNTDNKCANWNPEYVNSPRLTQQNITASWEAAGRPTTPRFYPTGGSTDPLGRPLQPDSVCIWGSQGRLDTLPVRQNPAAQPIWNPPAPGVRTVDDFQGLSERVNDVHNWAGRGILRYQPLEDMEWLLNGHGGRNRSGSRHLQMLKSRFLVDQNALAESIDGFSEVNAGATSGLEGAETVDGFYAFQQNPLVAGGRRGDDPFTGWYDQDGNENLDAWGTNLQGRWDLGTVALKWITGYEWYDRLVEDEGDATPELVLAGDFSDSAWQVTQDLRADGEGDRYRWAVGGYMLYEKLSAFNLFPATLQFRIDQTFDQELLGFAPYVGGVYELTDEVSVDAGFRYNVEKKTFTISSSAVGTASGESSQEIPEQTVKETWTGPTGDLTLNYEPYWELLDRLPNDSLRLYTKYSRGMKAGHFNAGLTVRAGAAAQTITPVEPESIHAAEVGFKSSWFDGRLVLGGALFHYWYKDLQVFDFVNEAGSIPTQQLLNSDARVLGAELEATLRPIPGLTAQVGFGWLDSEFKDFSVTKAVSLGPRGEPNQATFDYSGNPLISAPRFSVSGVVDYEIPLPRIGSLIPQYSFSHPTKAYFDPTSLDPISQPGYWLHNARLTYRTPDARIEVSGWVENFTDSRYKTDTFDLTLGFSEILEVWGDPRTYGFTVTYTF